MTTVQGSRIRTGTLRLRARFEQDQPLTLLEAQDALFGLGGLVYVAAILTSAEDKGQGYVDHAREKLSANAYESVISSLDRDAKFDVENLQVIRLSYNSPLEVVLGIVAGGSAITLLANNIIGLYERLERARVLHSQAKMTRTANAMIIHELEGLGVSTGDLRKHRYVNELLEGAATAAVKVTSLEIEDDDD